MKLAIVGYGKMGRLIEQLAPEAGFTVRRASMRGDGHQRGEGGRTSRSSSRTRNRSLKNVERLAKLKVPVVCGTTGWFDRCPRAQRR